ncbi:hypothetical protein JJQ72_09080, partial [Paenibacillus sp. F411]|uniref:hypothetical protein n=1 Tax=Paenibacillus sp. F411 TaxID=2820239 RepID=UPI001AAFB311
ERREEGGWRSGALAFVPGFHPPSGMNKKSGDNSDRKPPLPAATTPSLADAPSFAFSVASAEREGFFAAVDVHGNKIPSKFLSASRKMGCVWQI